MYGKSAVAAGKGDAVLIFSAASTCKVNVWVTELFNVSCSVIWKDTGPDCVGVPLKAPPALSDSHAGWLLADQV